MTASSRDEDEDEGETDDEADETEEECLGSIVGVSKSND